MKPYYETENGVLYHGDCLEIMPQLEAESVDLVLTDPPYGTTACKWDSIIPLEPMWDNLKSLSKNSSAIVMTATQPFTTSLVASNMKMFKCCWIWEKNRGANYAVLKYVPMKEHEDIIVFGKGSVLYNPIMQKRKGGGFSRSKYKYTVNEKTKSEVHNFKPKHSKHNGTNELRYPSSIQKFNCETGLHPTQKPVALMEYLIKTYTNEGDMVLDFTIGSGTTAVACERLGRKWIGIEKEKDYCDIAVKRIKEELSQPKLF